MNKQQSYYLHNPEQYKPDQNLYEQKTRFDTIKDCGHIGQCFTLSFYYLLQASDISEDAYEDFYFHSIREVISLGGDTDTNACIVGGILGALIGVHKIKKEMLLTLLSFNCEADMVKVERTQGQNAGVHACTNITKLLECKVKNQATIV